MANTDDQKRAKRRREKVRDYIQTFTNDWAEKNRLILQREFSPLEIDMAIDLTIDDYNATPPPLPPVNILSYPSFIMMIYGCTINLQITAGLLQSRNELNYSSGGVSVRTFDKTQLYQSWIQILRQKYEAMLEKQKISANLNRCYGGNYSEYAKLSWGEED